jgi:hypothetical protein
MTTRQLLPTTLALGAALLTLTTAAWATASSCALNKYKIRYYASDVDPAHHKKVVTYCQADEKPISCEAEIFSSAHDPNEQHKYFVALNEVHEYTNTDHNDHQYYGRSGCWARANTFYASYDKFHEDKEWQSPDWQPSAPPADMTEPSMESEEPYTETSEFAWGLKVYATCVPKYCVEQYETHEGSYESYERDYTPTPTVLTE